tara:strand:+ start:1517 stop:2692 length:1176 start_codon:yes stop_codon:yes gene_type:complete
MTKKITIIGGAGHIGLPLSILFANSGIKVNCYDKNESLLNKCKKGIFPFKEKNGKSNLLKAIKNEKINFIKSPNKSINNSDIIITIGTPVDEFMNPITDLIYKCLDETIPFISKNSLIILRSTVYPGTTEMVQKYLNKFKKNLHVVYCLERVVQGYAFKEINTLPQVIAATSNEGKKRATHLFKKITNKFVYCKPKEAEFSKLFSNAFRYIQFGIANQFLMISENAGENFNNIHKVMIDGYPRAGSLPTAGFAAGPCLFKDTMQLLSFAQNNFGLGYHAMLINEGLVLHIVNKVKNYKNIKNKVIGLLGMAFKANSDDIRTSLSYKLKKQLKGYCKLLLTTDPYVKIDKDLNSLQHTIKKSDILILCTPHKDYKKLKLKHKEVIDVWGYLN